MTDFVITCDTVSRLAHLATGDDEWFQTIRIDNGVAVASNRRLLACELIPACTGAVHLMLAPELVEQCRTEAQWDSTLTISVMDGLNYASAKTSLGWIAPGNVALYADTPNELAKWRDILPKQPAKTHRGALFMTTDEMVQLCKSSPSGRIVFEEIMDILQPTVVRDIYDDDWFGLFYPRSTKDSYLPATLPSWVKP